MDAHLPFLLHGPMLHQFTSPAPFPRPEWRPPPIRWRWTGDERAMDAAATASAQAEHGETQTAPRGGVDAESSIRTCSPPKTKQGLGGRPPIHHSLHWPLRCGGGAFNNSGFIRRIGSGDRQHQAARFLPPHPQVCLLAARRLHPSPTHPRLLSTPQPAACATRLLNGWSPVMSKDRSAIR